MDARYRHCDELPDLEQHVILTMPRGREFVGCRVWVEDDEGGGWAWAAVNECEAPRCWTDGVCWARNEDDVPSKQSRYWRYK